jgi:CHAD domain-containing protein
VIRVDPSDAECCFGAQAVRKRTAAAVRQASAVRENRDVEAVHDMRVACRRLRSALELFEDCLPPRKVRTWRRSLRRVTRALGEARDTDVQIQFVAAFLDGIEEPRLRPGMRRLLLRLRQKRDVLQADVLESLRWLQQKGVLGQIEQAAGRVLVHGQLSQVDPTDPRVRRRGDQAIARRLEQMLAYEPCIQHPEQVEQLHAMRIAAKHLRYAMEIFSPLYGEDFERILRTVQQVQTQLGEIHDCDVWIAWLPIFLEQERQRTVEYHGNRRGLGKLAPGIEHLRAEQQERRQVCHRKFIEFWQRLRDEDTWGQLYRIVAPGLEASAEPPVTGRPAGRAPRARKKTEEGRDA